MWSSFHWSFFIVFVSILLSLDLFIFHRKENEQSFKEALGWTCFWCFCSLIFNVFIYLNSNLDTAITYLTGYLVEWSLSIDNIFVFTLIFSFFNILPKYQYRVLFWGILGAMVIRMLFIFLGIGLVSKFSWMMMVFGIFLIFTGIKMIFIEGNENPQNNIVLKIAKRFLPIYPKETNHFFIKENNKLYITNLFLVLLIIESTDVLFAVDSIPAIIGISSDKFIVYTSNIFAILGLRSLYFLLSGIMNMFSYLRYGLCAILCFIGIKMSYEYIFHSKLISPIGSLVVILIFIAIPILISIIFNKKDNNTH